jgi:ABC-type transport system involved in cytochrome c biogenesis permease component
MSARGTQLLTVVRRELAGHFLRWRGAWIYPLVLGPLFIVTMHALHHRRECRVEDETRILAGIIQLYYVRVAAFLACAGVFTRVFRGDLLDRSLHYYLLAPMRRELLVVGKFVAGLLATLAVFETAVAACFFVMFRHSAEGRAFLAGDAALPQLAAYLGGTALAVVGFGAIFLAVGLVSKTAVLPFLVILGLETWSAVLPPLLQRLTVTYYLTPLWPVTVPAEGWVALLTTVVEPVPAWVSVGGLLALAAAALAFAAARVRRMEINYTTD